MDADQAVTVEERQHVEGAVGRRERIGDGDMTR